MARAGRGRKPRAEMDAARVLDLLGHLETLEIQVWLDGGWAIDALLGEQTREHDDLDLVSRLEDSARIEKALGDRGYVLEGGVLPHSFELVDAADGPGRKGRKGSHRFQRQCVEKGRFPLS